MRLSLRFRSIRMVLSIGWRSHCAHRWLFSKSSTSTKPARCNFLRQMARRNLSLCGKAESWSMNLASSRRILFYMCGQQGRQYLCLHFVTRCSLSHSMQIEQLTMAGSRLFRFLPEQLLAFYTVIIWVNIHSMNVSSIENTENYEGTAMWILHGYGEHCTQFQYPALQTDALIVVIAQKLSSTIE